MAGRWRRFTGQLFGGLIATAVAVPGSAAVLVTILYVFRRSAGKESGSINGTEAYVIGTLVALGFWVTLSFLFRARLTSVTTANSAVYHELLEQYHRANSRVESLQSDTSSTRDPTSRAALAEATAQLVTCRRELGLDSEHPSPTGIDWVLATGYSAVWRRLHRAQEALLLVEPLCDVVGTALFEEARLEDSAIPGRDQLLRQIRTAVGVLAPSAQVFLARKEEVKPEQPEKDGEDQTVGEAEGAPGEGEGRIVVRNTSRVINEFRDDRRDGLIRARNNLYRTVLVTSLAAYLLLGLALIRQVDELSIVAMASFYLVGAILGLFRQLGQASSIDTVKEGDYGLSTARLVHTPLFSGLAAVGGVVLVALLGRVIPAEDGPDIPTLREIFDLGSNQFGLVGAAIFGLTPNLLRQRLEKQAEQYKDDLKSTEASGATGTSTSKT